MASFESTVMRSYFDVADVTKNQIIENLIIASNTKRINLNRDDLRMLDTIIRSAVDQAFTNGSRSIQSSLTAGEKILKKEWTKKAQSSKV